MEQVPARATLVPAPALGDGLTTTIPRSEIQDVLAAEEAPIELVLDVTRYSDGEAAETRSVAAMWERSDLEQLLKDARDDEIVLTFDREALRQATEGDVEAHGLRETALVLAVAATAATGAATSAAAEPGPLLGGPAPVVQSVGPDDRAFARSPATAPDASVSPDDRAFQRVATPDPGVSPDDRAFPRVATPDPVVSPDDRAFPRTTPAPVPGAGTVSDPGNAWAPSTETVAVGAAIALAITGAFFIVGIGRRRVRPI